jgi:predicted amidohydrolase/NH3-dependent NAD+ synthetase
MRISIAQTTHIPGDIFGNCEKIRNVVTKLKADNQDAGLPDNVPHLVIFPELSVTGYYVGNLPLYHSFLNDANYAITNLATSLKNDGNGNFYVIVGSAAYDFDSSEETNPRTNTSKKPTNKAFVLHDGKVLYDYEKNFLPNFSIFNEYVYYNPGNDNCRFSINDEKNVYNILLLINDDLWVKYGDIKSFTNNIPYTFGVTNTDNSQNIPIKPEVNIESGVMNSVPEVNVITTGALPSAKNPPAVNNFTQVIGSYTNDTPLTGHDLTENVVPNQYAPAAPTQMLFLPPNELQNINKPTSYPVLGEGGDFEIKTENLRNDNPVLGGTTNLTQNTTQDIPTLAEVQNAAQQNNQPPQQHFSSTNSDQTKINQTPSQRHFSDMNSILDQANVQPKRPAGTMQPSTRLVDFSEIKNELKIENNTPTPVEHKYTDVIVVLNSTPYARNKFKKRIAMLSEIAKLNNSMIIFANLIGGYDDLVFDGGSFIIDNQGNLLKQGKQFSQDILTIDLENQSDLKPKLAEIPDLTSEVYCAIVRATKDYFNLNDFSGAILEIDDSLDSSIVASIAVDALGPDKVNLVSLCHEPENSTEEINYFNKTRDIAGLLECHYLEHNIEKYQKGDEDLLIKLGITRSNVRETNQLQLRSFILSCYSENFNYVILSNLDKSDIAVGPLPDKGMSRGEVEVNSNYSKMFAPIKDLYKSEVNILAIWRNQLEQDSRGVNAIPESYIYYEESDSDALNNYSKNSAEHLDTIATKEQIVIDQILKRHIEYFEDYRQILLHNIDPVLVKEILQLYKKNRFNRKISPIGPRVSKYSFGHEFDEVIIEKYNNGIFD